MKKKISRILVCLLALSLVLLLPMTSQAAQKSKKAKAQAKMTRLQKQVTRYIKKSCPISANGQSSSTAWSVYVKDLKTGAGFTINNKSFFSASTIKLYAMATVYDQAKKGKLTLTSSIESQVRSMINVSSNDAFNNLVYGHLGAGTINKFCKANGFKKTQQYTRCGDGGSAEAAGSNQANKTSAANCGKLLEKIYRGKLVSKSASRKMLSYLKSQTIRAKIPQGVPYGIQTANKTGESGTIENDTAIVYGKKTNYVICVFSNTNNPARARGCIQQISRMVYNALN